MAEKQLVVVVDGTASMGPYWQTILKDYLEKIIRYFCRNASPEKDPSSAIVELGLVVFKNHGPYSDCLVQQSGWTRNMDTFLQWLLALCFIGGGFNDAAIAEGLSVALMVYNTMTPFIIHEMFPMDQNKSQTQHVQRHCILVAANNPFPLHTLVHLPKTLDLEAGENSGERTECPLLDAEMVAKAFPQCFVSLSVISPKKLPKLRAIYDAGNCNAQAADPFDNKATNPRFLVLLSENFVEAHAALEQQETTSIPSFRRPVKKSETDLERMLPIFFSDEEIMLLEQIMNEPNITQPESPAKNVPSAIVKVESNTISEPAFPQRPYVLFGTSRSSSSLQTSLPSITSQDKIDYDDVKVELKPGGTFLSQNMQPMNNAAAVNASNLSNLAQASKLVSSTAITGGGAQGILMMGSGRQSHHQTMFSPMIVSKALVRTPQTAKNTTDCSVNSSVSQKTGNYKISQPTGLRRMGNGSPCQTVRSQIAKLEALMGIPQSAQNNTFGSFSSAASSISGNLRSLQPIANIQGSIGCQPPHSISQGKLSGADMEQNKFGLKRNFMDAFGQLGRLSEVGAAIPKAGMPQEPHGGNGSKNPQEEQPKYIKAWEGVLTAQIQGKGQNILLSRLAAYRMTKTSEMLTANWPETLQMGRLISQDFINNLPYDGHVDFLLIEAATNHRIFEQLQEKRLCANIKLPSQTLILSASTKDCRFIGSVFHGDFPLFRSQFSGLLQPPQQQPPQNQLQKMQGKGMNQT